MKEDGIKKRDEAARIIGNLIALADWWENCQEIGMPHCDCVNDASRIREMAGQLKEIAGIQIDETNRD